jgi:hypothetical protein
MKKIMKIEAKDWDVASDIRIKENSKSGEFSTVFSSCVLKSINRKTNKNK